MTIIFAETDPIQLKAGDRIKETENGRLMVVKTIEVHSKEVEDPRAATSEDLTIPEYISISYHFANEPETSLYALRCNPQWRCLKEEDDLAPWQIAALKFFEGKTVAEIGEAQIHGIGEATAQKIAALDPLNWESLNGALSKAQHQQLQEHFS